MARNKIKLRLLLLFLSNSSRIFSQDPGDTAFNKKLNTIHIFTLGGGQSISHLADIDGTYIHSGKKSEVIRVAHSNLDLVNKSGRQLFAKVPGVFVYDMDGSGNQINVSARGLDAHRGWEFNTRKDGVITNSDMYGYPASHYSMPMESIERIELVRGTGALQYGAQFGGMLNYISKDPDLNKKLSFENHSTIGSYQLFSNFLSAGGRSGKFKYQAYYSKRSRNGYREMEHTDYSAASAWGMYEPAKNLSLKLAWSNSNYTYRMSGQLTDSMFREDPRQATRTRNYFNPNIHIPSITLKWEINNKLHLQFISSAVLGRRNSVMWDRPANIPDSINAQTLAYNPRQVDVDRFNSFTNELRLLKQYRIGKRKQSLVFGLQYINNRLHRTQLGQGTSGTDYDLSIFNNTWGRDLEFLSTNIAIFAEQNFQVSDKFSFNLGARFEQGESDMTGTIIYYPSNKIPVHIDHKFPIFGSSLSYKLSSKSELYAGFAQAYRPVIFKDLVPGSIFDKIDPAIKDAKGYNAEIGYRGSRGIWKWDVSSYQMLYENRVGTIVQSDSLGNLQLYRTNIGNSLTHGLELFVQAEWPINNKLAFTLFTSTALVDGKYISGSIRSGNNNPDLKGKYIESAPRLISRNGGTLQSDRWTISLLYSYTASSYTDALNTHNPSPNGAIGFVPAYSILDLNFSLKVSPQIDMKASINNVFNKSYFSKRPVFYPGPGIWPSDGRNANFTVIVRME